MIDTVMIDTVMMDTAIMDIATYLHVTRNVISQPMIFQTVVHLQ